jgi:hypothetical protein
MIYVLHHSKGALMLSAEDREQVLKWSKRQLGSRAGIVSIFEGNPREADSLVERDGTGIKARKADGCHPEVSIVANGAQDVLGEHGCSRCHDEDTRLDARMEFREPTWH